MVVKPPTRTLSRGREMGGTLPDYRHAVTWAKGGSHRRGIAHGDTGIGRRQSPRRAGGGEGGGEGGGGAAGTCARARTASRSRPSPPSGFSLSIRPNSTAAGSLRAGAGTTAVVGFV